MCNRRCSARSSVSKMVLDDPQPIEHVVCVYELKHGDLAMLYYIIHKYIYIYTLYFR